MNVLYGALPGAAEWHRIEVSEGPAGRSLCGISARWLLADVTRHRTPCETCDALLRRLRDRAELLREIDADRALGLEVEQW